MVSRTSLKLLIVRFGYPYTPAVIMIHLDLRYRRMVYISLLLFLVGTKGGITGRMD